MPHRFEIPASSLDLINKRLKRAEKRNPVHGLPYPTVTVVERHDRSFEVRDALARLRGGDKDTRTVTVATAVIEVDGFSAPVGEWSITGYRSLYRVRSRDGDIVRTVNSGDVPAHMETRDLCCEHCGFERNRLASYVVGKEGQEPVEVGATCIQAFLGTDMPVGYAKGLADNALIFQEIRRIADDGLLANADDIRDELETVIAVANSHVSKFGYVSTKAAYGGRLPTWRAVHDDVRLYRNPDLDDSDVEVTMADFLKATDIVAWVSGLEGRSASGEFMASAREILGRGISELKDVAVVTALVGVYYKETERDSRHAFEREVTANSRFVGVKDEKRDTLVKVRELKPYVSRFGSGEIVTMLDGSDNLMVWFTKPGHGLLAGRTYSVVGTVARHERVTKGAYEGCAQTVLTRVKVGMDLGPTVDPVRRTEAQANDQAEFEELVAGLR